MKGRSIFTGVKLSDQTPVRPPGTDQRLFSATDPTAPPPSPAIPAPPTTPAEPPVKHMPSTAAPTGSSMPAALPAPTAPEPAEAPTPAATPARFAFDPTALPHRKDSFLFTTEEFEALEDLKLAIGRTLGVKATKQNLVRCAVAYLIQDWRRKGAASPVIAPLKRSGR